MAVPSDSQLLDALEPYGPTAFLQGRTIPFMLLGEGTAVDPAGQPYSSSTGPSLEWTPKEREIALETLAYVSTLIDVSFVEVHNRQEADLEFLIVDKIKNASAYAAFPEPYNVEIVLARTSRDVQFSATVLHEVGHALGMSHPFDGDETFPGAGIGAFDFGDFYLNSRITTMMSYSQNRVFEDPDMGIYFHRKTFGALDIAAIQERYGANTTTNQNDTVYSYEDAVQTIWDTGGIDTIDLSKYRAGQETTLSVHIDLRPATLLVEPGGGGFLSYVLDARQNGDAYTYGGYTIAHGVEIENGIGGAGSDTLMGNNLHNYLQGGGGADVIAGGAGNDVLVGDRGLSETGQGDTALYNTEAHNWEIRGGSKYALLTGPNGERDKLFGIEFVQFDDRLIELSGSSALDGAGDPEDFVIAERVALLYEATLNRDGAIDLPGLNFYIDVTERDNLTDEFLADDLMTSPEFTANFGEATGLSNSDFLERIYLNVLDRPSDTAGRQFYLDLLESGTISKALTLADIAISPENTIEASSILMGLYESTPGDWAFL